MRMRMFERVRGAEGRRRWEKMWRRRRMKARDHSKQGDAPGSSTVKAAKVPGNEKQTASSVKTPRIPAASPSERNKNTCSRYTSSENRQKCDKNSQGRGKRRSKKSN